MKKSMLFILILSLMLVGVMTCYGAEGKKKTYHIRFSSDSKMYQIEVTPTADSNSVLQLFDKTGNELQTLDLGRIYGEITFNDVNQDGYVDIVVFIDDASNNTYEIYVWNRDLGNYQKVEFKGFDVLAHFEVYDGYLKTWIKKTSTEVYERELVWDGDSLVLTNEVIMN